MFEVVGNIHMHTRYSDGAGWHDDIITAALAAALDFVIVTDHNVWVGGIEGYYHNDQRRVLMLVGEEAHDMRRDPQVNHCLVIGAEQEMAHHAPDPQGLINAVREAGGYTFLAHPDDPLAPFVREERYPWVDWEVRGFTGLELWNYMSNFKKPMTNLWDTARTMLTPEKYIDAPSPETLARWDELLTAGERVAVIGGSDAHATTYHLGPISRCLFPYEMLFKAINTHLLLDKPLTGDFERDKQQILQAVGHGRGWVGYDQPHPTRGFRFSAQGRTKGTMGETIQMDAGVTLQLLAPTKTRMRLLHHGREVAAVNHDLRLTYLAMEPGAYRAECWLPFEGQERGWIFSNPIYLK